VLGSQYRARIETPGKDAAEDEVDEADEADEEKEEDETDRRPETIAEADPTAFFAAVPLRLCDQYFIEILFEKVAGQPHVIRYEPESRD
jgi:hypothetical protein